MSREPEVPGTDRKPARGRATAVRRLHLPERAERLGLSVREADRFVAAGVTDEVLDTTHFDTARFPPPPWAAETFAAAAADGARAYTPYRGAAAVRRPVAEELGRRLGTAVDPDRELLLTPGSQAGLFATLAALVSPGDTVALLDPDYLFSERILRLLGVHVHHVPLVPPVPPPAGGGPDDGLVPDLDELAAALRGGASTVLFSHPNNPTGAVYPPGVLARIAALVREHDAFAVVDELYARLVYDAPLPRLAAEPGMRGRCATVTGPSKTESLSGYRVGVVVAPGDVVDGAEDVLAAMSLRAPAYAQHLLTRWLRDDEDFVRDRLAALRGLRERTAAWLADVADLGLRAHGGPRPPGTAYVFVDAAALGVPDHVLADRLVREAGVLVSPGYQFGPRGIGSFRVCYARDEAVWDAALGRMTAVLRALAH
ncbi:aminotransferase class I/II-fold pyridoxal phosphate-dependent enzyme [Streptomyces sp. WMMC500]|uniref:pyridoxal phosphate-dependent aminotransferase n=1 Tax=Streptomyces sp. WMMC500 TaxID=3015154 RepID=UPI00248B81BF|nr:aminotransferase class I/II-fold pyridoxal phosphate-dependent enzyme [Streptomyces sp. WMMC500]WBB59245.1 aminotransferase class I/II-fold pyridoxal phosphate-dependent enzyme [Streptomyces sp. WMMC500]